MADLADLGDVIDAWRSLDSAEETVALQRLRQGSAEIRVGVTGVDDLIADSTSYADFVREVLAVSVVRSLRGLDRRDSATSDSAYVVSSSDILRLVNRASSYTSLAPIGSFPEPCPMPVF